MASFDIVCEIDIQEVTNAVDQARREIDNRYDFKGSNCEIDFDKTKPALMITADDEMKMQTTIDVLLTKLIKRSVPVKSLVYGKTEPSGRVQKKEITVQQGLTKEQCKTINQFINHSLLYPHFIYFFEDLNSSALRSHKTPINERRNTQRYFKQFEFTIHSQNYTARSGSLTCIERA